jgi:hypothetical protein
MRSSNAIAGLIGILGWKRLNGDEGARLEAQLHGGTAAAEGSAHPSGAAQERARATEPRHEEILGPAVECADILGPRVCYNFSG